jgi:HK97 family phage portal protein
MQGAIKKALYDLHPELEDRIPLMRLYSDEQATLAGSDSDLAYYATNAWVHKAVKVVRDAISQLDVYPVDVEGQPIPSNPLYERLQNPNPNQSPGDLWSEWVVQMMLGGEIGFEAVWGTSGKKVLELWPREGKDFSVLVESARYRRISGYRVDDGEGDPYKLTPAQMVHFRFYNPANKWRGLAPISAVRMGVVIDQLAQAWVRLFYKNQARPDYAVIAPEGVTQSERKELEEKLEDMSGNRKANIYIRPHHFDITLASNRDTISKGIIDHINPAGSNVRVEVTDEFKIGKYFKSGLEIDNN